MNHIFNSKSKTLNNELNKKKQKNTWKEIIKIKAEINDVRKEK